MRELSVKRQINGDYCGPAVIQAILAYNGHSLSQRTIGRVAKTNKNIGTSAKKVASYLRSWDLKVVGGKNQTLHTLKRALKKGKIVIVCYSEPKNNEGHWAILHTLNAKGVLLLDSLVPGGKRTLPLAVFINRWHDPMYTNSKRLALFVG